MDEIFPIDKFLEPKKTYLFTIPGQLCHGTFEGKDTQFIYLSDSTMYFEWLNPATQKVEVRAEPDAMRAIVIANIISFAERPKPQIKKHTENKGVEKVPPHDLSPPVEVLPPEPAGSGLASPSETPPAQA